MKVFKFPLEITGHQVITIPDFIEVLSVAVQHNALVLYAFVDSEEGRESKIEVTIIGTGHDFLPMTADWDFQGSHIMYNDTLVWHVWTRFQQ